MPARNLEEEGKQTLFKILDAFVSKKLLKNALSNALELASLLLATNSLKLKK